jgi:hypothetical protein
MEEKQEDLLIRGATPLYVRWRCLNGHYWRERSSYLATKCPVCHACCWNPSASLTGDKLNDYQNRQANKTKIVNVRWSVRE